MRFPRQLGVSAIFAAASVACTAPVVTQTTPSELVRIANDDARARGSVVTTRAGHRVFIRGRFDATLVPKDERRPALEAHHPVNVTLLGDRLVLEGTRRAPERQILLGQVDHVELEHRKATAAPALGGAALALAAWIAASAEMQATCDGRGNVSCPVAGIFVVGLAGGLGGLLGATIGRELASERHP